MDKDKLGLGLVSELRSGLVLVFRVSVQGQVHLAHGYDELVDHFSLRCVVRVNTLKHISKKPGHVLAIIREESRMEELRTHGG